MRTNIKLQLERMTPVRLLALLTNVESKLNGSTVYPTPPVLPAALSALAQQLEDAIEEATRGSQASKAARDLVVEQVKGVLRETADYVRMVAKGDKATLAQSGFELAKVPAPVGPVGTPLIKVAAMTGKPGEVRLRWTGVPARRAYHVYVTDQDPTSADVNWQLTGVTSKVSHVVTDLVPYKAYWLCVSAIGALGEGVKSDPSIARAA